MKQLWELYRTFFVAGMFTFGGGYAMLPIIQKIVVEEKNWATDEEIADYYAIGQCTPGIIAVNTSTFVGEKVAGIAGGITATLGFASPSVIVVTLIAMFFQNFAQYEAVQNAFECVRICVCVLVLQAVIKIAGSGVRGVFAALIFLAVLIVSIFTDVQPFVLVLASAVLGIAYKSAEYRFKIKNNTGKEKNGTVSQESGDMEGGEGL